VVDPSFSGRWAEESEDYAPSPVLQGLDSFEQEFEEGPVYRSLGGLDLAQPSGDGPALDTDPFELAPPVAMAPARAVANVEAEWLAGANPPLIRRQRAFNRDSAFP